MPHWPPFLIALMINNLYKISTKKYIHVYVYNLILFFFTTKCFPNVPQIPIYQLPSQ